MRPQFLLCTPQIELLVDKIFIAGSKHVASGDEVVLSIPLTDKQIKKHIDGLLFDGVQSEDGDHVHYACVHAVAKCVQMCFFRRAET